MSHKGPQADSVSGYHHYDGPDSAVCIRSYIQLVQDVCIQLGISIPEDISKQIEKSVSRFVECFFAEIQKLPGESEVKAFADLCKARRSDLADVSNLIAVDAYNGCSSGVLIEVGDNVQPAISLAYIPKKFEGILFTDPDYTVVLGAATLSRQPRFYIYLYKFLFALVSLVSDIPDEDIQGERGELIRALLLLPVSLGQIFEKLNPGEEEMTRFGNDVLNLLQKQERPLSRTFIDLFNQVKEDIQSQVRPKRYVTDFRTALIKSGIKDISQFSKRDYYATLKASTSSLSGERYCTFVSSLFEVDPLANNPVVKEFDSYIGYESGYLTSPLDGYHDAVVRTIMIPNPSKYKPRAIHIADNAIQDRCKYIHNRMAPFLNSMGADCMKNQRRGVDFLERVSNPSYRRMKQNGIFASDFSNATDTLSQQFQNMCLDLIFPNIISRFWGEISRLEKTFEFPNGETKRYMQTTGQPQGLLGSFDAFSLAHHVLMLMLMKMSGLEDSDPLSFYRVLGDDSVVSTPNAEEVYRNHSWLCEEVSLIKNDSKSTKSFLNEDGSYDHLIIDFAKVSVYDGKFCSPIPSGLALGYSEKPRISKPAVVLWFDYHGLTFKKWMDHLLVTGYSDPPDFMTAASILYSGEVPYLSNFENKERMRLIDSTFKGCSIFAYGVAELRRTLFGYFVSSDKEKALLRTKNSFESAWEDLLPQGIILDLVSKVPDNHKYLQILWEGLTLAEGIQELYDVDDVYLAEAIASLSGFASEINDLGPVVDRLALIPTLENDEELFQLFTHLTYQDMFPGNKLLGSLQRRSLREKMSAQAGLLQSSCRELRSLFKDTSLVSERMQDCAQLVIDAVLEDTYQ